jgi:dTDP-4-dehydrorhamnose reductase
MELIWVTGANGQLGSELQVLSQQYPQYHFRCTDVEKINITDYNAVSEFLEKEKITVILNCSAYTAVDKAELEFELANAINHLAVAHMAQEAKRLGIKMIHISTDYVFDGTSDKPYSETDVPNPKSVYGQTKLYGENAMIAANPSNSIIIRTAWVYSSFGTNFVKTMLHLATERDEINVVDDQVGSPTYAADLASVILTILPKLDSEKVELYHYSNEGQCTWYNFAKTIFNEANVTVKINPIPSSAYPTPAYRPTYSLLNKHKITTTFSVQIRDWHLALKECLARL